MTSSDLPPAARVDGGDAGARPRWPSQQQALGLAGAFLLGACLCGGAGLAIGAFAGSHHSNYGPAPDGYPPRDDYERYRRDFFWPYPILPAPAATPPAAPAPPVSPTPSVSPSRSASPTPSTSPS